MKCSKEDNLLMKRILITGGSGTVGASFIEHYQEKYEFFSQPKRKNAGFPKRQFPTSK